MGDTNRNQNVSRTIKPIIDWDLAEKLWNNIPLTEEENEMVKRSYNVEENEPEQSSYEIPSAKEHLLQVVDFLDSDNPDIMLVKLEVVGGDEQGRTLINRCNLDQNEKGFFFTRMFLKAIGEPYKGVFEIETDRWIGRQFYAVIKHSEHKGKTYANIDTYNFDKVIKQGTPKTPNEIEWEQ